MQRAPARLDDRLYEKMNADREGWTLSPRLGLRFRLWRREVRPGRWSFRLEHSSAG